MLIIRTEYFSAYNSDSHKNFHTLHKNDLISDSHDRFETFPVHIRSSRMWKGWTYHFKMKAHRWRSTDRRYGWFRNDLKSLSWQLNPYLALLKNEQEEPWTFPLRSFIRDLRWTTEWKRKSSARFRTNSCNTRVMFYRRIVHVSDNCSVTL